MIEAKGLTVCYDGVEVVSDVDVDVRPGSITGVLGRSGSGKTTLLRALAGLVRPARGSVTYGGSVCPRPGSIAMLAQHPRQVADPRWTLAQTITEPARIAGRRAERDTAAVAAQRAGLALDLLDRFPSQVSDGQLQRACLARVLVQRPGYLLCDEPTAMLDPISARAVVEVISALARDGVGVALVSHSRALVRARSRCVLDLSDDAAGQLPAVGRTDVEPVTDSSSL
ncbi:ABC transporter ATP-binding protein [Gordonia sp. LUNF6]|uniref:ABC transporter ATP-binding protein n=1 Tax=Gordonia sp. LUNF6 TaxID=3388658 RepID=UPI00399B4EE5